MKQKLNKKAAIKSLRVLQGKKAVSGFLGWALLFFVIAIVASLLGFGFISGASFVLAKWLAIIFIILFIVSVVAHTIKSA